MAEVMILNRNQTIDNLDLLEEIQRNNTREQEVQQALKKEDRLAWEQNKITYMEGRIYIPNNRKLREKILWVNYDFVNIRHPEQQRMM